jgi:hypothetical protein
VALAGLDAGLASDDELGHAPLALNLDVQFTSDSMANEAVLPLARM